MRIVLAMVGVVLATLAVRLNAQDLNGNGIVDRLELPGTQPSATLPGPDFALSVAVNPATDCMGCHTTLNGAGPVVPWSGSMMGNAARDPVFWAQLDVAEADEAADSSLAGARDLCLRCHIGKGWLEGRSSSAPLSTSLRGMAMQENDLFGVQCALCHRMVDRTGPDAIDAQIHAGLNTNPDPTLRVPPSYGNGMYIVDRFDVRRGPFGPGQIGWVDLVPQFLSAAGDWPPAAIHAHAVKNSAFHRSGNLCGTCHDVSNPAWTPAQPKGDAQLNFPIERTWTEWTHSAYPAKGEDGSCQACHMNGVLNGVLSGGASGQSDDPLEPYRHMNDLHFHDLTGGNVWVPMIIGQMIQKFQDTKSAPNPGMSPVIGTTQSDRDTFLNANFAWVLKTLYPAGTFWRAVGLQPPPPGIDPMNILGPYAATSERAKATLGRAAELSGFRTPMGDLKLRVWNMTGHKLPTGYPEGRRMWLDVRFLNVNPASAAESLVAQSGQYDASTATLFHDFNLDNAAGPKSYDVATYTDGAGNPVPGGRRTQVYEARMHHTPSGTEFHFIRNNERLSDNRIPPLGWVKAQYQANLAEQVTPAAHAALQMVYHDNVSGPAAMPPVLEETYNFDETAYPVPSGTDVAEVNLWYQSVSREYVEELVAASPRTLVYPAAGGPSTFTRGDVLEYAWRTFNFSGQTRVPPVAMAKLRIALVDGDGDGLPDDWETAQGLNPASANGDDGRHGDPDADGRSNYLEFQSGTPANAPDTTRPPMDLALVLDFSGSMNEQAPAGSSPKIEVLKDAVDLFLRTWKQYAIRGDRIAVVYFSSNVAVETGALIDFATLAPGVTIEDTLDSLIAAVRARVASGTTAMGGGLQTAYNLITPGAPGRIKRVILFTNGMQNYSPMVRKNAASQFVIQSEPINPANGVFGDSGVTAMGGPAFGTALASLGIPVHTLGIGVSETADDRWQSLISGISADTLGLNQFISRAFELEGAFLNNLVLALRGFSPTLVRDNASRWTGAEQTFEFPMDAAATKATFILSWAGSPSGRRLSFELIGPDGKVATALTRLIPGKQYLLAEAFFPLANTLGRPVGHAGLWRMKVISDGGRTNAPTPRDTASFVADNRPVDFRAYLIADVPEMRFDARFGKARYRAGEDLILTATSVDRLDSVRTMNRVMARVTRPGAAQGTVLSKVRVSSDILRQTQNAGGDQLPDLAAAKSKVLLGDPLRRTDFAPIEEQVELFDDGNVAHGDSLAKDGVFSARLAPGRFPGLVRAVVSAEGMTARSGSLARRAPASVYVGNAPFSRTGSRIVATRADGGRLRVTVTPKDGLGNFLGPGFRDRVSIRIVGRLAEGGIVDGLDGSYTQTFQPGGSIGSKVTIDIDGDRVFRGTPAGLLGARYLLLFCLWLLLALLVWMAVNLYLTRSQGASDGP